MYAVIETGGKQYRVEVGTELQVELLDVDAGDSIKLDRILLVADGETAAIGRPVVENASVAAEVLRRERGEKTISFKYRPKARRRVKKGHRQELTVLRISDIVLDGKSAAGEAAQADAERRSERQKLEAAARRQAEADAALAAKLAADKPVAPKAAAKAAPKAAPKRAAKADAATSAKADTKKPTAAKAGTAKPAAGTAKPAAAKTESKVAPAAKTSAAKTSAAKTSAAKTSAAKAPAKAAKTDTKTEAPVAKRARAKKDE